MGRRGMTLMELVVVMAILAMLAGVAVRGLGELGMQGRVEATRRTLEVMREGVLGSGMGGGGFVADMGRLPRLGEWIDGGGLGWLGAVELADGDGLVRHGMHGAAGSNLVARYSGVLDEVDLGLVVSGGVGVLAGWRGPYVVGRGERGLPLDGWGRLLAGRVSGGAPGSCWMLSWQTNGVLGAGWVPGPAGHGVATTGGMELSGLACEVGMEGWGGSGREWVSWERREVWADPVVVQVRDDGGRWAGGGRLLVMWYGPNPEVRGDGRPLQVVVQALEVGGGTRVAAAAMSGWSAPTHGPRVFRACVRAGGTNYDTGPVHVLVGAWTSLVELRLP